jgi:hypothetical protein
VLRCCLFRETCLDRKPHGPLVGSPSGAQRATARHARPVAHFSRQAAARAASVSSATASLSPPSASRWEHPSGALEPTSPSAGSVNVRRSLVASRSAATRSTSGSRAYRSAEGSRVLWFGVDAAVAMMELNWWRDSPRQHRAESHGRAPTRTATPVIRRRLVTTTARLSVSGSNGRTWCEHTALSKTTSMRRSETAADASRSLAGNVSGLVATKTGIFTTFSKLSGRSHLPRQVISD